MPEQISTTTSLTRCGNGAGAVPQVAKVQRDTATIATDARAAEQARAYISLLTGSPDTEVTLQLIADPKVPGEFNRPAIYNYSLGSDAHLAWLVRENREFLKGVFVTVNETDLLGRRVSNIIGLRALFVDDDQGQLPPCDARLSKCPPSFSVRSKRGWHHYWLLTKGQPLSAFTGAQMSLAACLGTDTAVKDLPRVMRVPGFLHVKDPASPFAVELLMGSGRRHTIDEVVEAYPAPPDMAPTIAAVAARSAREVGATAGSKQGLHCAPPDPRFTRKLLAALLGHPLVRWMCENGECVSYELWRATATNIAAACADDVELQQLGRRVFHRISSGDVRYRAATTDTAFDGAIASAQSHGPVTFAVMIAAGAPEELCTSDQRSLIADARLRLAQRRRSHSRRQSHFKERP